MLDEQRAHPETASCAPFHLYHDGGLYDAAYDCKRLETLTEPVAQHFEFVAEMFARGVINRPEPVELSGPTPANYERLLNEFRDINHRYSIAPPSVLVKINCAIIWKNMLFLEWKGRYIPIYECYRQNDRQEKGGDLAAGIVSHAILNIEKDSDGPCLFIGSAGSFNYGHWLTDDFPRYRGAQHLLQLYGEVKLVLSRFNEEINAVRMRALELISGDSGEAKTIFLDPNTPYRVGEIYYVTPVSYHPFIKNPEAVEYVRGVNLPAIGTKPSEKSLYINRYAPWPRLIVNNTTLLPIIKDMGFHEFVPDRHTLDHQIAMFRDAKQIIGIMGAGMANVIFSSPDTRIVFMAPDGWNESYFWDLVSVCGQDYKVLFSTGHEDGHHLYQRSFEVDPLTLVDIVISNIGSLRFFLIFISSKIVRCLIMKRRPPIWMIRLLWRKVFR